MVGEATSQSEALDPSEPRCPFLYQRSLHASTMCSHIFRLPHAEKFGELITADRKTPNEEGELSNDQRYAVTVQDLATQWIQSYLCKTTTSQESTRSLQKFLDSKASPKVIYIDKSLEFRKACEDLQWDHCTSTLIDPLHPSTVGRQTRTHTRFRSPSTNFALQQL